jgi:hypothetical protein
MNERIKQLAEQARLITVDAATRYASDDEFEQRFAELLVEECATVIEQNLFQGIGWNTSKAVKRHFGIGEEE